jgi:hypothetical protein
VELQNRKPETRNVCDGTCGRRGGPFCFCPHVLFFVSSPGSSSTKPTNPDALFSVLHLLCLIWSLSIPSSLSHYSRVLSSRPCDSPVNFILLLIPIICVTVRILCSLPRSYMISIVKLIETIIPAKVDRKIISGLIMPGVLHRISLSICCRIVCRILVCEAHCGRSPYIMTLRTVCDKIWSQLISRKQAIGFRYDYYVRIVMLYSMLKLFYISHIVRMYSGFCLQCHHHITYCSSLNLK